MLCDVALFGEVKLPTAGLDAFLTAETREAVLPGFPLDAIPATPRPVEAVLEELKTWPLMAPEWLDVRFDGGTLSAKGLVSRDTFMQAAPALVSLYRTAAPHGGGGTLLIVGLSGAHFGYSVRCAYGRSSVRTLSAVAIRALRCSTAIDALREGARTAFEPLLGEGAGGPFTGAV